MRKTYKYEIDYGGGVATFVTPCRNVERRFKILASTFIDDSKIDTIRILFKLKCDRFCMDEDAVEGIIHNRDVFIWNEDGARRCLYPDREMSWDERYCKKCKVRTRRKKLDNKA